ncbi:hypothetical protein D1AOALGA4SA_12504 [Olavius algarvensis Delta 1 endosymbiont]|nr:hypothetical protein D1AOALGA4SA_12504 [Olavius algarvensis Delta 1 endosymbiont]
MRFRVQRSGFKTSNHFIFKRILSTVGSQSRFTQWVKVANPNC